MKIVTVTFALCKSFVTFQLLKMGATMLYFAYGSNLWRQQMTTRCPGHIRICTGRLNGWRWIITTRGYASLLESDGDYVLGIVFELSDADVMKLDHFEGVADGNYRKEMICVDVSGQKLTCMVYIDAVSEEGKPIEEYVVRINSGIRDAGFPVEYVTRYLRPFIPE